MDSGSKTESLEFTGREAIYMEDDKKVKKDSKKKRDRSNSKPGRSCFYLVDPCGCSVDPCGCYSTGCCCWWYAFIFGAGLKMLGPDLFLCQVCNRLSKNGSEIIKSDPFFEVWCPYAVLLSAGLAQLFGWSVINHPLKVHNDHLLIAYDPCVMAWWEQGNITFFTVKLAAIIHSNP